MGRGRRHPIAMAAGIMPEATPLQLIEAAARAGFDYGGMWYEPSEWTSATTRAVKAALGDTGLRLLDIEVLWIKPGPPDPVHERILETGAELGARNALVVSSDPDRAATRDKLARLMERGAALGIRVNLEFGLFTEVKTISAASALLEEVDSPAGGLLIDALHWTRSGGTAEDVTALPKRWLCYAQLCDAPAPGPSPDDAAAILAEAIDGRCFLGDGGLPVNRLLSVLPPDLPLGIEQRSKALRDAYPDLLERARVVQERSRAFIEGQWARRAPLTATAG